MSKFIISVLGSKGGSSKTTTAHLLAYGLARFRFRTILLSTDHEAGRLNLSDTNRIYKTRSGQTTENLKIWFEFFENLDESKLPAAMVVDGGGNRQIVDDVLAKCSDLVLLTFRDSEEDIRVLIEDMRRLPKGYALPSVWQTNNLANIAAKRVLHKLESRFPNRILTPVPSCRATQQLLREEFLGVDSNVNSIAKNLTFDVLSKLGINPFNIKF